MGEPERAAARHFPSLGQFSSFAVAKRCGRKSVKEVQFLRRGAHREQMKVKSNAVVDEERIEVSDGISQDTTSLSQPTTTTRLRFDLISHAAFRLIDRSAAALIRCLCRRLSLLDCCYPREHLTSESS